MAETSERYLLVSQLAVICLKKGILPEVLDAAVKDGSLRVRQMKSNAAHPIFVVSVSEVTRWLGGDSDSLHAALRAAEEKANKDFLIAEGMDHLFEDRPPPNRTLQVLLGALVGAALVVGLTLLARELG